MLTSLSSLAQADELIQLRREHDPRFEIDEGFQAAGGVQLFFDVVTTDASQGRTSLVDLYRVALDPEERWRAVGEPHHVSIARLSHTLNKDISWFTRERAFDVAHMRAIAPTMDIRSLPDGGFQVSRSPANTFGLSYLSTGSGWEAASELAGHSGSPVVIQRNENFSRIAGWRTGAYAVTITFHQSLGPGRTRVTVLNLNALHNLPPKFLGGKERLYNDLVEHSRDMIGRLRTASFTNALARL